MNSTFNIVMCQDTCKPICFKLGMMLDTTELYSLIPVWITLILIQGHWFIGKRKLVQSSVVKWHEVTQMFMMVDYVGKKTVKKSCKYGEYGSFEHLNFPFYHNFNLG